MTVLPFAIPVKADPMKRLANHQRSCLLCYLSPPAEPPLCGQRLWLERDVGYIRPARKEAS